MKKRISIVLILAFVLVLSLLIFAAVNSNKKIEYARVSSQQITKGLFVPENLKDYVQKNHHQYKLIKTSYQDPDQQYEVFLNADIYVDQHTHEVVQLASANIMAVCNEKFIDQYHFNVFHITDVTIPDQDTYYPTDNMRIIARIAVEFKTDDHSTERKVINLELKYPE